MPNDPIPHWEPVTVTVTIDEMAEFRPVHQDAQDGRLSRLVDDIRRRMAAAMNIPAEYLFGSTPASTSNAGRQIRIAPPDSGVAPQLPRVATCRPESARMSFNGVEITGHCADHIIVDDPDDIAVDPRTGDMRYFAAVPAVGGGGSGSVSLTLLREAVGTDVLDALAGDQQMGVRPRTDRSPAHLPRVRAPRHGGKSDWRHLPAVRGIGALTLVPERARRRVLGDLAKRYSREGGNRHDVRRWLRAFAPVAQEAAVALAEHRRGDACRVLCQLIDMNDAVALTEVRTAPRLTARSRRTTPVARVSPVSRLVGFVELV